MTTGVSITYVATVQSPNTQARLHDRMAAVALNTSDYEAIGVTLNTDATTNIGDDDVARTITFTVDPTVFNAAVPEDQAESLFRNKYKAVFEAALNSRVTANPPVIT
jgi:hypothetical protein